MSKVMRMAVTVDAIVDMLLYNIRLFRRRACSDTTVVETFALEKMDTPTLPCITVMS